PYFSPPSRRGAARPRARPSRAAGPITRRAAPPAAPRRTDRRSTTPRSPPACRGGRHRSAANSASGLLPDKALIRRLVHHPVELFRIREPDLDEPALAHRIGVDLGRIGDDVVIDRDNLARNRRIDLARRLR